MVLEIEVPTTLGFEFDEIEYVKSVSEFSASLNVTPRSMFLSGSISLSKTSVIEVVTYGAPFTTMALIGISPATLAPG